MLLTEAKANQCVIITKNAHHRLLELGLLVSTILIVVRNDNIMIVSFNNTSLVLGHDIARSIHCERYLT